MSEKPETYQVEDLAALPEALLPLTKELRWIVWKWKEGKTKWTKPPYQARNPKVNAKKNDPSTWASHAEAVEALERDSSIDGIGFNLLDSDYGAIDLDDCRDAETGSVAPWATEILNRADGTYAEVTVSGTGLRVIGKSSSGEYLQRKINGMPGGGSFEIYRCTEKGRYITISGRALNANGLANIDELLDELNEEHSKEKRSPTKKPERDSGKKLPRYLANMLYVEGAGVACTRFRRH
jgi:primase-polymerase (primpol)-like protein